MLTCSARPQQCGFCYLLYGWTDLTFTTFFLIFNLSFKTGEKSNPYYLSCPQRIWKLEYLFYLYSSLLHIWNLLPPPRPHTFFFSTCLNTVAVSPCRSSFSPPDSLHFYCSALNELTLAEAVPHLSQSVSYPSTEKNVLSHRCAAVSLRDVRINYWLVPITVPGKRLESHEKDRVCPAFVSSINPCQDFLLFLFSLYIRSFPRKSVRTACMCVRDMWEKPGSVPFSEL